jgi:hypothetical protein
MIGNKNVCSAYSITIEHFKPLLSSSNIMALKILDFIPLGSNYCGVDYNKFNINSTMCTNNSTNSNEITNKKSVFDINRLHCIYADIGTHYYNNDSKLSIRQFLDFKYLTAIDDIVLTKNQFDTIEQFAQDTNLSESLMCEECMYDSSKTDSMYDFRISLKSDFCKRLLLSPIESVKNFLDSVPVKVELYDGPWGKKITESAVLNHDGPEDKMHMTIRDYIGFYSADKSERPTYHVTLTKEQFNNLVTIAMNDQNIEIGVLILADEKNNTVTRTKDRNRIFIHGLRAKNYDDQIQSKKINLIMTSKLKVEKRNLIHVQFYN